MNLDSVIGVQQPAAWHVGEGGAKTVATLNPRAKYEGYLDVTIVGRNAQAVISYGTGSSIVLVADLPLRCSFKGVVQIECNQLNMSLTAFAKCAVVKATAAGPTSLHMHSTGATAAPVGAVRMTALDAVTGTIDGIAFALAAGESLPVIEATVIVSGSVIWELTA